MKRRNDSDVVDAMKVAFILWVVTSMFLTGCHRESPEPNIPSKTDVAQEAIGYARDIVSDPSNWKGNSVSYTRLGESAQDLGIVKSPEFQKFEAAANKLITFGTQWVSNVDEGSASKLKNDLSHLTTTTEANAELRVIGGPAVQPPAGGVNYETKSSENLNRTQAEAEHAIFTTVNGLRAAQADEFGRIFQESQSAFLDLRALLLAKIRTTPTPSHFDRH